MGLLEGKVAAITGAGSGVGQAAARIFAREGARIVAIDLSGERLEETAGMVLGAGGQIVTATADVSKEPTLLSAVEKGLEAFGRLDIMYNNAGISSPYRETGGVKSLPETTDEDWERLQNVNIKGVLNGCRIAVNQFDRQGGGGVIVNTASVAGLMGWGGVIYCTTKGGVVNLTRTLALEVGPRGIRVNSVCPSGMVTRFFGEMNNEMGDVIRGEIAQGHPLRQPIEAEDCANAALFLASDLAVKITGVNLPVDAGFSAGR